MSGIRDSYAKHVATGPLAAPDLTGDREGWMDDALCAQVGTEMFFPDKGGSTRAAKRVCAACPVAAECLQFALRMDERFGIWGGLSEQERRKLRLQERAA